MSETASLRTWFSRERASSRRTVRSRMASAAFSACAARSSPWPGAAPTGAFCAISWPQQAIPSRVHRTLRRSCARWPRLFRRFEARGGARRDGPVAGSGCGPSRHADSARRVVPAGPSAARMRRLRRRHRSAATGGFRLVTGRALEHYNTGSMTRRTDNVLLLETDWLELHPNDAAARTGGWWFRTPAKSGR